jgi:membrane associated rhomboid family serine protease
MDSERASPLVEVLAVFVVVYAVQFVTDVGGLVGGLFVLSPPIIQNPWTVVTSVYAHASTSHLVSNAVALVLFGWPVARETTRVRFHAFFAVTGAVAGISQILLSNALAGTPVLSWFVALVPGVDAAGTGGVLGASGAVFALLGYLLASNRLSVGLRAALQLPGWAVAVLYVVVAGALTLATAQPGVALIAHFTGLLLGLFAGRLGLLSVRKPRNTPEPHSDAPR